MSMFCRVILNLTLISLGVTSFQLPAFAQMDHSAHRAMMQAKNSFVDSQQQYDIPDVVLLNQDGQEIHVREFLQQSEPYALNFIFTTCTTICPILTASFSHMQRELGTEAADLQFVSVSIDPEYDTPKVLKAYAEKLRLKGKWMLLTGKREAIIALEKAFNAYTAEKMNHRPIYIFKLPANNKWIRVDGLASGSDLADLYRTYNLFQD